MVIENTNLQENEWDSRRKKYGRSGHARNNETASIAVGSQGDSRRLDMAAIK
jgi:hypothetical protein